MSISWITQNWTERVTRVPAVISTDHAYIHKGYMFSAHTKQELATGASYKITFETPTSSDDKYVHWRPSIVSTSGNDVDVTIYEGSTGNTGGTETTPMNRDRLSANTSKSTVTLGATVTSDGTEIDATYIGGGTNVGGNSIGSSIGENNEIIFKQDETYTIVITNGSDSDNNVFIKLLWYEEDDA